MPTVGMAMSLPFVVMEVCVCHKRLKMYAIKPSFQGMFAICANFHYPNSLYANSTVLYKKQSSVQNILDF